MDITAELDLKKDTERFLGTNVTFDEILEKFQYHPSVRGIRETFNNNK